MPYHRTKYANSWLCPFFQFDSVYISHRFVYQYMHSLHVLYIRGIYRLYYTLFCGYIYITSSDCGYTCIWQNWVMYLKLQKTEQKSGIQYTLKYAWVIFSIHLNTHEWYSLYTYLRISGINLSLFVWANSRPLNRMVFNCPLRSSESRQLPTLITREQYMAVSSLRSRVIWNLNKSNWNKYFYQTS